MEADRSGGRQPIEGRRQDVLTAVLLHVIEAPEPIDRPADWLAYLRIEFARLMLVKNMQHCAVVFVEYVHDSLSGGAFGPAFAALKGPRHRLGHLERADVERLPARGWIECRAIQ